MKPARIFLVIIALAIGLAVTALPTGCGRGEPASEPGGGQLWTCGMHPQVVQSEPGTCPICGMELTPMKPGGAGAEASSAGAEASSAGAEASSGQRKIKYWQAPMDPTYIRDKPGKSPMGMDLIPVYEDEVSDSKLVEIDPGVIQQIGVETAPVERTTVFRHLRTIGEVEVGEDELSVVNLRFSGWVERIHVDKTGDRVERGQVLFEIYSPELVAAQEEYLLARRSQGEDGALTRAARHKLELWDLSTWDIEQLAAADEVRRAWPIRAPSSGFVLHKNIVEGARVKAGTDLYRIGNLERIWVTAEVYEHDAPWVEQGQPAQMELSNLPGEVFEGQVSYVYPTLDERSRTLTVRLEFDNPGVQLKPGMFATVYIQYRRLDGVVAVPTSAILHSGRRDLVFVALGQGRFEPREIVAGLYGDHRMTEVRHGLEPGELVVTSSQFLIDSESQLQEALAKILAGATGGRAAGATEGAAGDHGELVWSCPMHPEVISGEPGRCPECGMSLEQRRGTEAELEQVYGEPVAQPGQYTCPMHPEVISDEPGRCPECGMFLEKVPEATDHDATDHDAMDHDAMDHDAMDHDAMDHDAMDHGDR